MKKKTLLWGLAALVLASCGKDMGIFNPPADYNQETKDADVANYESAFVKTFGAPAATQDWGFGSGTRAVSAPAVAELAAPYDEAWVTTYKETAKEPNSENINDNYDNSTSWAEEGYWTEAIPGTEGGYAYNDFNWTIVNSFAWGTEEYIWKDENIGPFWQSNWSYYGVANSADAWKKVVELVLAKYPTWLNYTEGTPGTPAQWVVTKEAGSNPDETYVRNFKITGTYSGTIPVVASEGILPDHVTRSNAERTVVVTGTWNITADQRVGEFGKIIIANGGTVSVAQGVKLNMVNEARLVVLRGGKLTGAGSVEVNNGNAVGEENYNAGTIDVATFNNNFGKFYNYGDFKVNEYQAGAVESNFYNHKLVAIDHTAGDANARVFNACQFYVKNNARLRNYEGVNGSALIVGGQFMPFGSEDGTTIPSYVSLAAGALVKCGSLYNGSSWVGPTEGGYAALEVVNQIDYLNWVQDSPQIAGYFANNIYVKCGTWQNDPAGQGKHQDVDDGSEWGHINYTESRAEYKFWTVAANCTGNGHVTKVGEGTNELLPADEDFELGVKGCTPGFKGDTTPTEQETVTYVKRVMAEDLSASEGTDFDFNDVVFDVAWTETGAKIKLLAAGGTLPLYIGDPDLGNEVHGIFAAKNPGRNITTSTIINTRAQNGDSRLGWHNAVNGLAPVEFPLEGDFKDETGENNANKIQIWVVKNGKTLELTAVKAQPASKFACPVGTDWADEFQNIDDKWPTKKFTNWVQGGPGFWASDNTNE